MPRKLIAAGISVVTMFALSIFTFGNALALDDSMDATDGGSAPLTAVSLCKDVRQNYGKRVAAIRATGLSLQLSPEEIRYRIDQLKDYKKLICFEAKYGYAPPLTSARQLCKEAQKDYRQRIKDIRAVGLSLQLSAEDIKAKIKAVRDYRKQVCKEAKKEKGPMP